MFFVKDIEWVRTLTRRTQRKQHRRSVRRNYRRIFGDIKHAAKNGYNKVTIRFSIYDENVRRLVNEGYKVEKRQYASGNSWEIKW